MFPISSHKLLIIATALSLSACATQQTPAPVVSGYDNSVAYPTYPSTSVSTPSTSTSSNPYGATPYTPDNSVVNTGTSTYTPSTTVPTASTPTRPYVGNYSPVDKTASTHTVTNGDTVYNIAKRYGISQADLRAWNNIGEDNSVHLGQTLRVKPVGSTTTTSSSTSNTGGLPTGSATYDPAISPPPSKTAATTPIITGEPTQTISGISWQAPTKGSVVRAFGGDNKGIDVKGTKGQPVVAAADGQVVYSGAGLRGYGNLIIIQHSPQYLTAYGHNEAPLLVGEGQKVKRGQQIAKMGNSDSSSGVKLHFELRENGTPVNPTRFVKFSD